MVHPWPGIKVAIAIPGPSMDQAWPGMELPWTIHGHGWNAIESEYGCIAIPILDLFPSTFVFKEQTHRASVLIISGLKLHSLPASNMLPAQIALNSIQSAEFDELKIFRKIFQKPAQNWENSRRFGFFVIFPVRKKPFLP